MKLFITFIILLVVIATGVMIGMRNDAYVDVNFLIVQLNISLSMVIAISFGFGFILAWILCGVLYFRLFFSSKLLKRNIKKLSMELENKETHLNQLKRSTQLDADFLLAQKSSPKS